MCCYVYGLPMLVPSIRHTYGISLARAGVVVAAPGLGVLLTLFAWGYASDRWGERLVITTGLAGASAFLVAACFVHGLGALCAFLALAGAAGASVNSASGRVVLGWFDAHERGLAMGVRQTAQPLRIHRAPRLRHRMTRGRLTAPRNSGGCTARACCSSFRSSRFRHSCSSTS
jgi:MFS family permease